MSKRLSRNQSGYSERELTIYRCIILCLYSLVILAIIVIDPLLAILFKNPYCGLYSLVPTSLFLPMRMFIDRVFPRLSPEEQAKRRTTSIRKIPPPSNTQPSP
jgi:hypothetical protein